MPHKQRYTLTPAPRVLCACEHSQHLTSALRRHGVLAYSCDLQPAGGGELTPRPDWHITGDAVDIAYGDRWTAVISFPPCTDLSLMNNGRPDVLKRKRESGAMQRAADFARKLYNAPAPLAAVENPRGYLARLWRPSDVTVSPADYGGRLRKLTCLWLRGLPAPLPSAPLFWRYRRNPAPVYITEINGSDRNRARRRSLLDPALAAALAEQWTPAIQHAAAAAKNA